MGRDTKQFEDVVDFFSHMRVPVSTLEREKIQGDYPYYGAQGVIDYVNDYIFDGEYVLIAEDGANLVTRNQPIAQIAKGQFWVNNHAHVVRAKEGVSTNYFINALINSMNLTGYVTGAAQPKLSQKNLCIVRVSMPPLDEQIRIASTLSAYDNLIENNQRRIQLLEQSAQLLYKEWFVHLRFPGHEHAVITDGVPAGWKKDKVAAHIDFIRGVEPGSKNYMQTPDEGLVSFLRVGDFGSRTSNIFIDASFAKGNMLQPDDVAITMDGTPGVVGLGMAGAFSSGIRKVVPKGQCGIGWSFIYALLKSDAIQATVAKHAKGTTILHASSSIEHMRFLQPPERIRDLFEEVAAPLLRQVLLLMRQNQKLSKTRDLLLPRLMSGEVAV